MASKIGILVIHGIGTQKENFAATFIRLLEDRGISPDKYVIQPVYWARETQDLEDKLWRIVSKRFDLNYVKLRQFVISVLSDATAYVGTPGRIDKTYRNIHQRVYEDINQLAQQVELDSPLVIVAHSLGSVIMSNYIWDIQQQNTHFTPQIAQLASAFEKMETLAGIFTFGSNIPLFALGYDPITAIELPTGVPWFNFFDADDILGYPLKDLSNSNSQPIAAGQGVPYDQTITSDIEINAGNILTSWNPLSHEAYWTDEDIVNPIAAFLKKIRLS